MCSRNEIVPGGGGTVINGFFLKVFEGMHKNIPVCLNSWVVSLGDIYLGHDVPYAGVLILS